MSANKSIIASPLGERTLGILCPVLRIAPRSAPVNGSTLQLYYPRLSMLPRPNSGEKGPAAGSTLSGTTGMSRR
jgi:hypothetical protein